MGGISQKLDTKKGNGQEWQTKERRKFQMGQMTTGYSEEDVSMWGDGKNPYWVGVESLS